VAAALGGPWRALGDLVTAADVVAGVEAQQDAQASRAKHEAAKAAKTPRGAAAADHLDFPRWSLKVPSREAALSYSRAHARAPRFHNPPPCLALQAEQLILERPKVLLNAATGKYILWFHLDATHAPATARPRGGNASVASASVASGDDDGDADGDDNDDDAGSGGAGSGGLGAGRRKYWLRRAGVAVADRPEGPFLFAHALRPDGEASLDLQVRCRLEVCVVFA
jgi:hypothetical protein